MRVPVAQRLREAAASLSDERVSIAHLMQAHGTAAQGSLLLMLSVPCLLPIPGTGTVLGLGLIAMAVTLWRGQAQVGLPPRVGELQMSPAWARRVLNLLAMLYAVAACVARARRCPPFRGTARRWIAAAVGAMAVVLVLPIPFGNVLPALALVLVGLGWVFRDGIVLLVGLVASAVTALLMVGLMAGTLHWGVAWMGEGLARLGA